MGGLPTLTVPSPPHGSPKAKFYWFRQKGHLATESPVAGWAGVAFTLDRYAHVLPGMQERASGKLEAILFGE